MGIKESNHCVGAEIQLPRGNEIERDHVVAWSHRNKININRDHTNPMAHTRIYQVEFAGGKVAEFAVNVIAESMYFQCDADGNEY